jgi:hypothetical protein
LPHLLFRKMNDIGIYDPRPMEPPSYWDDDAEIERELIVDGHHGIYVPQTFCQRYYKTDDISQEDWDICLAGPDHEGYWEAWDEILSWWATEETDGMGNVFKIFLEQDQDLFQCREFVRAEYSKKEVMMGID